MFTEDKDEKVINARYYLSPFFRLSNKNMFAHKKLSVWKGSMELVVEVYKITSLFPKSEIFGLSSQIRRSAGSIPANISEGAGRGKAREFIYFLRVASASLSELDTHLELAFLLRYLDEQTFMDAQRRMKRISAQLSGLIRAIDQRSENKS